MKKSPPSGAPPVQAGRRLVRITIDPRVADEPYAHRWLDRILHKVDDGWHVWDTTDHAESEKIAGTTWIRDRDHQGAWVRDLLIASTQRDAWTLAPHGRSLRVTAVPTSPEELTPEEACRLVEEPLCILVENRITDGAFIRRVIRELDHSLHLLWGRPGEPVRVDSVGGKGQMHVEVERRVRKTDYRPRLVAIIDSDRKSPDARPSAAAVRLRRTCEVRNLPCWLLAKREAENYLPRPLLDARPDAGPGHARRVDAWDRLTDDQKDFIDMKNGLASVDDALFGDLSPADRSELGGGFGPKVYKCWELWNITARVELVVRGSGDLERGVEMIRREV